MLECINVLELERPISFYSLDIKGSIVRLYMQNTFVLSLHCGVSLIVSVASIDTLFLAEKVVLIFVECIRFDCHIRRCLSSARSLRIIRCEFESKFSICLPLVSSHLADAPSSDNFERELEGVKVADGWRKER